MKLKITVLIMIMIISLFGCSSGKKESFKAEAEISVSSSAVREEPERVCVYVCGEVACRECTNLLREAGLKMP